jgi:DNA-directed RNA polymerase subunit omega
MIIPLDLLISNKGNIYEMTCATLRRALQVTVAGGEEAEENGGKIVSTAISQILNKKVEYRLEE